MKKLKQEFEAQKEKSLKYKAGVVILFLMLILVVKVVVANRLVAVSDQLSKIDVQKSLLQTENQMLTRTLAELENPQVLKSKALLMGFTPVGTRILFAQKNDNVAAVLP